MKESYVRQWPPGNRGGIQILEGIVGAAAANEDFEAEIGRRERGEQTGHGGVTRPQTQCGYTAFEYTKLSRDIGVSGAHVGTVCFKKLEADASDKKTSFMLREDEVDGPYYPQQRKGVIQMTLFISGGMRVLRVPAFFENLEQLEVVLIAGGGTSGHKHGLEQGATLCRREEEARRLWKAGTDGDDSLLDGAIEYAGTHGEFKGAVQKEGVALSSGVEF